MSDQLEGSNNENQKSLSKESTAELNFWQRSHGPVLLTLVGGGIDTIGFIGLFGFFTNHVTGNLVTAGSAVVNDDSGLWIDLAVLPVFILTVILTKRVVDIMPQHKPVLSYLLFAEVAFLAAFMVSALYFSPFDESGTLQVAFTGFLGLIAFAVRNTANKTVMGKTRPTLLMTGNTTQLGMDLSDYIFNRSQCNIQNLKYSLAMVTSFVLGAFLGTVLYMQIGFWSIAPFILPVLYLAIATRNEDFRVAQNMTPKKK